MLVNKKGHNESAPTTPHLQGISQPCSIGHLDPTSHKPHPTSRTTIAIIIATTTSPRVIIIQHQKPVSDVINQDTVSSNALIKPQTLP